MTKQVLQPRRGVKSEPDYPGYLYRVLAERNMTTVYGSSQEGPIEPWVIENDAYTGRRDRLAKISQTLLDARDFRAYFFLMSQIDYFSKGCSRCTHRILCGTPNDYPIMVLAHELAEACMVTRRMIVKRVIAGIISPFKREADGTTWFDLDDCLRKCDEHKPILPHPYLMSPNQLKDHVGLSMESIWRYIRTGVLKPEKVLPGGHLLFDLKDATAVIAAHRATLPRSYNTASARGKPRKRKHATIAT